MKRANKEKFDFYRYTHSYFKVLKRFLGDVFNVNVENIYKNMYNMILSEYSEDDIMEIQIASGLLENKLLNMTELDRNMLASELYYTYVTSMLLCYHNHDYVYLHRFFNSFNERAKELSGFYGIYGDNNVNLFCSNRK